MNKALIVSIIVLLAAAGSIVETHAQGNQKLKEKINKLVDKTDEQVVEWRRYFHANPELSNREFKTAEVIAEHLTNLGMEVRTGIAHTGVIGILKGGKPGKTVALRADIDALPVVEDNDLPYKSTVKSTYNGMEVGVMHACGHDTHIAILMGTAEVLASVKDQIEGTVMFIFQPAEEGAPEGEEGGAELMLKEGAFDDPRPDAVFGLHINSLTEVGQIRYVKRGTMASADFLTIKVKGDQTHGGYPWDGIDPVVTSAQIINGLQTIVSRRAELLRAPAVVTVATIHGGVRNNIIPTDVEMTGTIRALDTAMQNKIHDDIRRIATNIAEANGAKAEVTIRKQYPVTYNDPDLTDQMLPSLVEAAGEGNVNNTLPVTGAEDFSFFAREVPGLYFFLGGMPKGTSPTEASPHHTPTFIIDDSGLDIGVKSFCYLVVDYLNK